MASRVLADRYELGDLLGRGGMATVYAATDRVLERQVAVKVLADQFGGDEEFVERFRREARASAALNHPNIVSVYDTGSDDGTHFIVMEQVRGRTLATLLAERGALTPERAAAITASVARALEAAHAQNLVHRDIKPGNVLLTDAGEVKVTDFGIARAASGTSITVTGAVLGTASYLSPEQAQGGVIDARSDIYSLGCVLYEMLAGRPPFTGESPVAVATQHVADAPAPPSSLREGVPPDLEAIALRAMAKDPEARFASAAELATAVENAVTGEVTVGLPVVGGGDATQALPRTERTAVLPAAEPGPPARERVLWPWVAGAVALALLGFLLARALFGTQPSSLVAPTTAPPPVSEQTTTPPAEALPSVGEAHAGLVSMIQQGAATEGLSEALAEELIFHVDEAVRRYEAGEGDQAQGQLLETQKLVATAGAEGTIADTWQAQISAGVTTLAHAMEANPIQGGDGDGEGDGGEDPGQGKGEGKGKGKNKDGGGDD